jgi:hypothetical protein
MASQVVPMFKEKEAAVSKIELRAIAICEQARAIHIATHDDAQDAAALLNQVINPLIREGDELFDPMIASAYQTHQVAIATKRKAVGALPAAKTYVRGELARWQQLLDDQARAERLRLEQIARDEEAARIEREIEAVEAAAGPNVVEEVAAILEAPRPELVMAPALPPPKIDGISGRDVYAAEVVNLREFYRAIGDGRTAVSLAEPRQGDLNRMAAAMKEGFNVAGCRLVKTKSVSSSSKRSF